MEQPYHFKMELIFRKSDINKVLVKARNRRAISAGFLLDGCHQWCCACQENVFCFFVLTSLVLLTLLSHDSSTLFGSHKYLNAPVSLSLWLWMVNVLIDPIDRYVTRILLLPYYHFLKSVWEMQYESAPGQHFNISRFFFVLYRDTENEKCMKIKSM